MDSADEDTDRGVRGAILAYLLEHPAAGDTAAGIRLWWLRDAGGSRLPAVKEALEELVEQGWLLARGMHEEDRVYSMNSVQREAIERYVTEGSVG